MIRGVRPPQHGGALQEEGRKLAPCTASAWDAVCCVMMQCEGPRQGQGHVLGFAALYKCGPKPTCLLSMLPTLYKQQKADWNGGGGMPSCHTPIQNCFIRLASKTTDME